MRKEAPTDSTRIPLNEGRRVARELFTTFVKKKLKKISFWDFCFIYINILSSFSISFLTIWNLEK